MDKFERELQDNYEDALFALLMDDYAKEEGEHLLDLANQLNADETYTLPDGMETRGLRTIRMAFRKKNLHYATRLAGKVLSKVAIFVLILNVAFGISFFSVEAFRAEVLNMMLSYQETHTSIQFVEDNSDELGSFQGLTVEDFMKVLPKEYSLVEHNIDSSMEYAEILGEHGEQITWYSFDISAAINLDTEDADYTKELSIGTVTGLLVEKDGDVTIVVGDVASERIYQITANIERSIAENYITKLFE